MRKLTATLLLVLAAALPVSAADVAARDVAHRALLEKHDAYRAAVASFDRDGVNAVDFERIAAGATDPALRGHATYFLGRAALNRDDFDTACASFERVLGELATATAWTDEAVFFLAYSFARRPELDVAKREVSRARAKSLLERLPATAPERILESARWLLRELAGDGSGPLLELVHRMETIERSIEREQTGRPTQARQEAVISEIDRLIELMREKEAGGKPPAAKGRTPSKPGTSPGRDAERKGGTREGEGQPRDTDLPAMQPSERAAALQLLKEKFPERYNELVEQYFRSLAGKKGSKK